MPTSTYITLVIICTLEAVLIVLGNRFTIFVFWTERSRLKRTYFLLINLAVADLLVGITELIIIGTAKSHNAGEGYGFLMRSRANPIAAFILLFSGTSVYSLVLISMERAFAVLPLTLLGDEMWKIKLQKIAGNLLDKFRKLYNNGTFLSSRNL